MQEFCRQVGSKGEKFFEGGGEDQEVHTWKECFVKSWWHSNTFMDDHVPEKLTISDGSFSDAEKDVESFFKINFVTDWSLVSP